MKDQLYWTETEKVSFRFAFIFILSFIILKNNDAYPFFNIISKPFNSFFEVFTPWFAKNILKYTYDYSIFTNGSGDTSYDWVSLLILFILSLIGCVIWSIFDRKRTNYNKLYYTSPFLSVII